MSWETRHKALMVLSRWFAVEFDAYQRRRGAIPQQLQSARETHCSLLSRQEVEDFCRQRPVDLLEFPEAFEIKPPNHHGLAVSVLKLKWHREAGREHCLVNFGSWSMMALPPTVRLVANSAKREIPVFTGFRFETPEVGANHAYYHSQPSRSLGNKAAPEVAEALSLSSFNPTWPMAARDTVQLFVCVVLSLYGFDGFENARAFAEGAAKGAAVKEALDQAFAAVQDFQVIR